MTTSINTFNTNTITRTILFTMAALIVALMLCTVTHAAEQQVNINTADAKELTRLYRVGDKLAMAIVADREANGPFATVDDLTRVMRVGKMLVENNKWMIITDEKDRVAAGVTNPNPRPATQMNPALNYTGPVNVNTDGVEKLASLYRVGEKLAAAIVADREANGPFVDAKDLTRVMRLGDKIVEANADRLVFETKK